MRSREQEIEFLRSVQRLCAEQYQAAQTQRQRDWHMLGIADYLMEEILIEKGEGEMAYLKTLKTSCLSCDRTATHELFDNRNELHGAFCTKCAQQKLAKLQKEEQVGGAYGKPDDPHPPLVHRENPLNEPAGRTRTREIYREKGYGE